MYVDATVKVDTYICSVDINGNYGVDADNVDMYIQSISRYTVS